jgi:hypothetical protein
MVQFCCFNLHECMADYVHRSRVQSWTVDEGPVWFSFFLTSFSENLAVGESKYHYDYVWRKIKLFIGLRI